jgi:LytR_cpsA_psr family
MTRKSGRSAAPWLALLSLVQIAASGGLLLLVAILSTGAGACGRAALVPPRAPGRASYLDVSALVASVGTTCAEASAPAAIDLIAPFADEALRRREQRAAADPTYAHRIDPVLNQGRINFLLFGYGETYEPPYAPDFKGSINIFSLDTRTLNVSSITLNHDIRAPEVERFRQSTDRKQGPTRIDQSYPVGGFDIMRLAAEDATGLAVDYQLVINDGVIKDAVNEVFGGLDVNVPFEFDAMPISFNSTMYPARHYAAGVQTMDGLQAIQFVKALNAGAYDRSQELAVRKQIIVQALAAVTRREAANPIFWSKALGFMRLAVERKTVAYDFDPLEMLRASIQPSVARGLLGRITLPTFGDSTYIVDDLSGDGGVEWVTGSANPIIQRELADGLYVDRSFSVPKNGANPDAIDLVSGYWPSVRQLIREGLTGK